MIFKRIGISFFIFLAIAFVSCQQQINPPVEIDHSFLNVKKSGKIKACILYNSIDYFVYKGEPMGLQLELVKMLARDWGVKAEFIVNPNLISSYSRLRDHSCDLIAAQISPTPETKQSAIFLHPLFTTPIVLIQNTKPKSNSDSLPFSIIRNHLQWKYDTLCTPANSPFYYHARILQDQLGIPLYIKADYENGPEQLMSMVDENEINYTLAFKNTADVNQNYFPNIDSKTLISLPYKTGWVVQTKNTALADSINHWLIKKEKNIEYHQLINKYCSFRQANYLANAHIDNKGKRRISPYDKTLKKVALLYHWDWRLLASLIYQESRFTNSYEGRFGTFGIMQLMPETAVNYGISPEASPEKQIEGGAKYIHYLEKLMTKRVKNPQERQKFVLASYNAGPGHIFDAMALATKYHKNAEVWEHNVDTFLCLKSKPKYFNDTVVKNGFFRGKETIRFVSDVMERFHHYQNMMR